MRGLEKILKETHTHTQIHDSNHGAAVAERSSRTQMLLSSSSQDEAVLCVSVITSCSVTQATPASFYLGWCLRSGSLETDAEVTVHVQVID